MPRGELDTRKPSLLPASLTAITEVSEELSEVLLETTGLQLPTIVDKLTDSNRAACRSGNCALSSTCELVPEVHYEADTLDPMNVYPEHTAPAYHTVSITCVPGVCPERRRTGRAIDEFAKLAKNAVKAQTDGETARRVHIADGSSRANRALEPGKQEAARIRAEAKESAAEAMKPYEANAAAIREEAQENAQEAVGLVIDQFRQSVPWLV